MYNIEQWPLTLYFDGECQLCAREIKILSRRAIEVRLLFFDISRDDFDAKALGFTLEQMQSSLHASFADDRWVTGLEVTLWSWRAAGLGMWATPLTWRAIRPLLAVGYSLFCRLRPYLAWLPHPDGSRRFRDNPRKLHSVIRPAKNLGHMCGSTETCVICFKPSVKGTSLMIRVDVT